MKLICINTDSISGAISDLTIGRIYEILYNGSGSGSGSDYYILKDDNGLTRRLLRSRFITVKEYRKRKLFKLNNI